jgi:hypothetical protein
MECEITECGMKGGQERCLSMGKKGWGVGAVARYDGIKIPWLGWQGPKEVKWQEKF